MSTLQKTHVSMRAKWNKNFTVLVLLLILIFIFNFIEIDIELDDVDSDFSGNNKHLKYDSKYSSIYDAAILQKLNSKEMQTVHLMTVSCGKPNYQGIRDIRKPLDQSLTMLKSASLFAQKKLHIHIFTEDDMKPLFQEEIDSWPKSILKRVQHTPPAARNLDGTEPSF